MVPNVETQDKIDAELTLYRHAKGLFGNYMAIKERAEKTPAEWWALYGGSAPSLQKFAIELLILACSASGCEQNLSVFENLHTKRRYRLAQSHLDDLVFVKYNRALMCRYQLYESIDSISLNDIDESNEWLSGRVDDENDREDELVFTEENSLTCNDVARAARVGESGDQIRSESASSRVSQSLIRSIDLVDEKECEMEEEEEDVQEWTEG